MARNTVYKCISRERARSGLVEVLTYGDDHEGAETIPKQIIVWVEMLVRTGAIPVLTFGILLKLMHLKNVRADVAHGESPDDLVSVGILRSASGV
jgi:hypothetical protein